MPSSALGSVAWCSISSGIDWLTCSVPRSIDDAQLFAASGKLLSEEEARGNRRKEWKRGDLRGHICGSVVQAVSPTHVVVSVSGGRSHEAAPVLLPLSTHVSRLDLEVTASTVGNEPYALADVAYEASEQRTHGGRPLSRTIFHSKTGGHTCYLGRRSSDLFGRVYDKGVEQEVAQPGTMWRWEIELKRDLAQLTARELALVGFTSAAAAELVFGQMTAWGVPHPIGPENAPLRKGQDQERNTVSRTLAWLERGVRPSIRYLVDAGHLEDVLRALGLPPSPDSAVSVHPRTRE